MDDLVDLGITCFGVPLYFRPSSPEDAEYERERLVAYFQTLSCPMKTKLEYRQMAKATLAGG